MNALIIGSLLFYALVTAALGLWTRGRNEDTSEDYYVASRSVSWLHLGLTVTATWFSTFSFLGAPGFFFTKGVKWYVSFTFYTFGGVVLFWFFSRKIWLMGRGKNYITPADLLADFYNSVLIRYLVGIVSLIALVPYALIQLVGIGKAVEVATNNFISYETVVISTGVVTAFYVFTGGVRAVLWTDIIQGILFAFVIVVAMGIAVYAAGGLSSGFAAAVEKRPELFVFAEGDFLNTVSFMATWTIGFITLPHLWQRSYMADSADGLIKSGIVVAFGGLLMITALMVTGVLCISFMDVAGDSDKLIVTMFSEHCPYAVPLLILAVFASGMSTVDSQLLTASSIFVRDIVKPLKSSLDTRTERLLGQYFLVGLIAVLVVLALLPDAQGPIIALATKGTALAVMLFIPLLGPTYLPAANKVSAVGALTLGSLYYVLADIGYVDTAFGLTSFLSALLLNTVVFFFLYFCTKK
ncbi:MAG: sodium:solute symporter family protein [Bdellovibrionales bacterium]|nr:sodium:solute symporter family protein [Bdellovibrionales bacterium]